MHIYKGLVMGLVSVTAAEVALVLPHVLACAESSFSGCYRVSAVSLRGAFGVSSLLPSADIYKLRRCLSSRMPARPCGKRVAGGGGLCGCPCSLARRV